MGLRFECAARRGYSWILFPVKTVIALHSGQENVARFFYLIGCGIETSNGVTVLSFILETFHSRFLQRSANPTEDS